MVRSLWTALGVVAAGLGLVGLALPVMPTVPFMILAAFAFGRGSPRMRRWTIEHPTFGPPVRRWEEDGAISRRHKAFAVDRDGGVVGSGLRSAGGLRWPRGGLPGGATAACADEAARAGEGLPARASGA